MPRLWDGEKNSHALSAQRGHSEKDKESPPKPAPPKEKEKKKKKIRGRRLLSKNGGNA